jgi:ABC-2 type transport system permease protein
MIALVKCGVLGFVREKSSAFFCLIFPVLLTFFLGNMLMGLGDNADDPIGKIKIAAYIAADSPQESMAVEIFLSSLDETDDIEVRNYKSEAACRNAIDSGKADAILMFTSPLKITVIEGENIIRNRAVLLMANGFSREYATMSIAMKNSPESLAEAADTARNADAAETQAYTTKQSAGVSRSMLDYYAVAMVIMIAFMGSGISGATDFYNGRRTGTLSRACVSPVRRSSIIVGSIGARAIQGALQAICVMVPSVLVFGVSYADKWQDNVLLFVFFILLGCAVSSVCAFIGLLFKFNPYMPIMVVIWILLFLSGTFSAEIEIPHLTEYLPTRIAQQAAFDLTVFGRHGMTFTYMAACVVVIVVGNALGVMLLKRKGTVI